MPNHSPEVMQAMGYKKPDYVLRFLIGGCFVAGTFLAIQLAVILTQGIVS